MAYEFTPEDLNLNLKELEKLKLALANRSLKEQLGGVIESAVAQVDLYTQGYALTEEHYRRLVRELAVYRAYSLAQGDTAPHLESWKAANQELKDIRDGKFPALATSSQEPGETAPAKGGWGSAAKINLRA